MDTFTFTRYASTQPAVGAAGSWAAYALSLTAYPHMRRTTSADAAYYAALQLRARGVCANIIGMNGI